MINISLTKLSINCKWRAQFVLFSSFLLIVYQNNRKVEMQDLLDLVDSSFKYIMLGFNIITLLVVYLIKRKQIVKKQHHILFVIAHPDDETMFFAPTFISLTDEYFIHLLCLCRATEQRAEQLEQSVKNYGIHQFKCVHNDKLIDGLKEKWCEETILKEVSQYVSENGIKAIFTFDKSGVSDHPNHKAIYQALSACEEVEVKAVEEKKIEKKQDEKKKEEKNKQDEAVDNKVDQEAEKKERLLMKIYYLQSVNLLRKYTGLLELPISLIKQFSWVRFNYIHAWRSLSLYSSEFVWYRKLWVLFSRYTYLNTYQMRKIRLP